MLKRFFIFLALVSILCGAFFLNSPDKQVEQAEPVWPVVDTSRVDRVDVCLPQKDCFSLVRRADGWDVAQHGWNISPEADPDRVRALLEALGQAKALRYLGRMAEGHEAEYGLDFPAVRIATGGGQELAVAVGAENPSGEGRFASNSREKGDLFLIPGSFVRQCEFPAEHYYNLLLLSGKPENITSISLDGGSFLWTLNRVDGNFVFSFPASLNGKIASSGDVNLLLHSLLETPAKGIVPDGVKERGSQVLNIEVGFSDKRTEKVEICELSGTVDFFLANSTVRKGNFVLSKEHFEQLDKKAFQMRQRTVLSIETGKVGSMRVLQGNQTFTGMKNGKTWVNFEDKKPLLGIDMSLWRLNELKFEAEPAETLSASAEKVMELELMNEDGRSLVTVDFFSDPELPTGQCWLSLGDGSGYYPVSDKLLEDLQGQIPLRK
ncbi:DUF4340 domain-containing protein [Maridesulfovibrio sp.]|uniref:DUF4340 domain-containing protein n=1 Tax=Maridesulfovibrio sp. TaxID=2795000 RepID=UPI002A188733|nr:DUF4340 domain-containing protein [Maridesulfovibrio sp.]